MYFKIADCSFHRRLKSDAIPERTLLISNESRINIGEMAQTEILHLGVFQLGSFIVKVLQDSFRANYEVPKALYFSARIYFLWICKGDFEEAFSDIAFGFLNISFHDQI